MSRNLPKRVNDVLARMIMFQEAGAIDYSRDVISQGRGGHGKHGTTTVAPTLRDSPYIEWADRFHRMCAVAERECDRYERGVQPRPRETSRERKRRIVTVYVGVPLVEAAFIEGCSTDLIRKTRAADNRDVENGTRLPGIEPGRERYESDHTRGNDE